MRMISQGHYRSSNGKYEFRSSRRLDPVTMQVEDDPYMVWALRPHGWVLLGQADTVSQAEALVARDQWFGPPTHTHNARQEGT